MQQKTVARLLTAVTLVAGVCACIVYFSVLPAIGSRIIEDYPEFSSWYRPWLYYLWGTAIPCVWAAILAMGIFRRIGKDNCFCVENAAALKTVSILAIADGGYFFLGQVVLALCGMNHPGVLLMSLFIVFLAFAVYVVCSALSHLVYKAAAIREENDLTI